MTELDEIAENLYPGYLAWLRSFYPLTGGVPGSPVAIKEYVHRQLSADQSYAVIDGVIESLSKLVAREQRKD